MDYYRKSNALKSSKVPSKNEKIKPKRNIIKDYRFGRLAPERINAETIKSIEKLYTDCDFPKRNNRKFVECSKSQTTKIMKNSTSRENLQAFSTGRVITERETSFPSLTNTQSFSTNNELIIKLFPGTKNTLIMSKRNKDSMPQKSILHII